MLSGTKPKLIQIFRNNGHSDSDIRSLTFHEFNIRCSIPRFASNGDVYYRYPWFELFITRVTNCVRGEFCGFSTDASNETLDENMPIADSRTVPQSNGGMRRIVHKTFRNILLGHSNGR